MDSQRNVHRGELQVRPPGAPTTAGRSGKGVLVRARSKQNRCLEELGVIRRVEEAGMMGEYRLIPTRLTSNTQLRPASAVCGKSVEILVC